MHIGHLSIVPGTTFRSSKRLMDQVTINWRIKIRRARFITSDDQIMKVSKVLHDVICMSTNTFGVLAVIDLWYFATIILIGFCDVLPIVMWPLSNIFSIYHSNNVMILKYQANEGDIDAFPFPWPAPGSCRVTWRSRRFLPITFYRKEIQRRT